MARTRITKILDYESHGPGDMEYCTWLDSAGQRGVTVGHPGNTHMEQLKARAVREGFLTTPTRPEASTDSEGEGPWHSQDGYTKTARIT